MWHITALYRIRPTSMATLWTGAGWESSRMGPHVWIVTTWAWNFMVILHDKGLRLSSAINVKTSMLHFLRWAFLMSVSLLCVWAYLRVSIPGHGGCKLTGGLTLLNPLLGVLRMMMWAVDTPWWFHFLRASSRSQREAVGVLQGQGLAYSQYDDNSMLAFSFPEETNSSRRPNVFAYFCSNNFYFAF